MSQAQRGQIQVDDTVYQFSPLTVGQARRYTRAIDDLTKAGNIAAPTTVTQAFEKMLALTPLMLESLKPNHPDLTLEQLENVVSVPNLKDWIQAMLNACWPEDVAAPPPGEAAPVAN